MEQTTRIEWWETRDGRRVMLVPAMTWDQWTHGLTADGSVLSWRQVGQEWRHSIDGDPRDADLIRPLPDCTGWDWVEPKPAPKWRRATEADIGKLVRVSDESEEAAFECGESRELRGIVDGLPVCRSICAETRVVGWVHAIIVEGDNP